VPVLPARSQPGIWAFLAVPITKVLCIISFIIATAPGSITRPSPPLPEGR
jgi:hypothetical protein